MKLIKVCFFTIVYSSNNYDNDMVFELAWYIMWPITVFDVVIVSLISSTWLLRWRPTRSAFVVFSAVRMWIGSCSKTFTWGQCFNSWTSASFFNSTSTSFCWTSTSFCCTSTSFCWTSFLKYTLTSSPRTSFLVASLIVIYFVLN